MKHAPHSDFLSPHPAPIGPSPMPRLVAGLAPAQECGPTRCLEPGRAAPLDRVYRITVEPFTDSELRDERLIQAIAAARIGAAAACAALSIGGVAVIVMLARVAIAAVRAGWL